MNAPEYQNYSKEGLIQAATNDDKTAQLLLAHRAFKEGSYDEGREYMVDSAAGGMTRAITLAAYVHNGKNNTVDALALALVAKKRGDISIVSLTEILASQLTDSENEEAQRKFVEIYDDILERRNSKYGVGFDEGE
jgi:hypothetical protein